MFIDHIGIYRFFNFSFPMVRFNTYDDCFCRVENALPVALITLVHADQASFLETIECLSTFHVEFDCHVLNDLHISIWRKRGKNACTD